MALKNLNPSFETIISPLDFDFVEIVNQCYIRKSQIEFHLNIRQFPNMLSVTMT
jgi:hypothetical protein